MTQQVHVRNPFMLMTNPEVILAAVEKSEHLGRLRRQTCRPLDRPLPGSVPAAEDEDSGNAAADEDPAADA